MSGNVVVYFGTAPYAAAATAGSCKGEIKDLSVTGNMEVVPASTDLLLFVGVQSNQVRILPADQSDAESVGIFSRWTDQTGSGQNGMCDCGSCVYLPASHVLQEEGKGSSSNTNEAFLVGKQQSTDWGAAHGGYASSGMPGGACKRRVGASVNVCKRM
eukprot:4312567-Pyramimonas_sp.AAC.1